MNIKINYDGKYPNLCSGRLIVYIDGEKWDFGTHCLVSGGCIKRDKDWNMWTEQGDWYIRDEDYPKDFPEEYKELVINEINACIPHGCCGGCI